MVTQSIQSKYLMTTSHFTSVTMLDFLIGVGWVEWRIWIGGRRVKRVDGSGDDGPSIRGQWRQGRSRRGLSLQRAAENARKLTTIDPDRRLTGNALPYMQLTQSVNGLTFHQHQSTEWRGKREAQVIARAPHRCQTYLSRSVWKGARPATAVPEFSDPRGGWGVDWGSFCTTVGNKCWERDSLGFMPFVKKRLQFWFKTIRLIVFASHRRTRCWAILTRLLKPESQIRRKISKNRRGVGAEKTRKRDLGSGRQLDLSRWLHRMNSWPSDRDEKFDSRHEGSTLGRWDSGAETLGAGKSDEGSLGSRDPCQQYMAHSMTICRI